jgi:hypothetical protein
VTRAVKHDFDEDGERPFPIAYNGPLDKFDWRPTLLDSKSIEEWAGWFGNGGFDAF